jgi:hypothetical protein
MATVNQKLAPPRAAAVDPHEAVTRIVHPHEGAVPYAPDPHEVVTRIARPNEAVTTIGTAPEPPEDRGQPTQITQAQAGDDFGDGDADGATQIAPPPRMPGPGPSARPPRR